MNENTGDIEFRVMYRRADWAPAASNKTRKFTRIKDVQRCLDRLNDYESRGLSKPTIRVSWRQVGEWKDVA